MMGGVYSFSGETVQAERVIWHPIDAGGDWLKSMHGFSWIRDFRAHGGDNARRHARALIDDWLSRHSKWTAGSWAPEILGMRVANWIALHDFYCLSADDGFRARIFGSLMRQSKHLARVLPGRVKGLDLLVALKGLALSGLCLPGGEPRLALALRLLEKELPRQILADGTHADRNPLSVLESLRHLIDLRAALVAKREEVPDALQHAIDRLTPALKFFRHGDGGLALFNGAEECSQVALDAVLAQSNAKGRPLRSAPHSGYERLLAGRALVIMDTGIAPEKGLDTFAHAAPLAFEFSLGRDRVVVNCGRLPGRPDIDTALRGTAAHSTVTLAERNAAELTASGGIGRTGDPVKLGRVEENGATLVDATHDGYLEQLGAAHRRRLYLNESGEDLRGEDCITGPAGLPFAARFHLHPKVTVSLTQGGDALLRLPSGVGLRFQCRGGTLTLEDSLYCPGTSPPRRTRQLVIQGHTDAGGALVKWAFVREKRG
jgi:uncharacterized heparinase superfamily protein